MSFGGLFGGAFGLGATAMTNRASRKEAKKQRKWQERMSNTQYQRAMTDMRAAGLNPMLAYQQGGAGTPPGAKANVANYADAVSSAMAGHRLQQELKNMKQVEHKDEALKDKADSDTSLNNALEQKARVEAIQSAATAKNIEVQTFLSSTGKAGASAQEALDKTQVGRWLRVINRTSKSLFGNDQTSAR